MYLLSRFALLSLCMLCLAPLLPAQQKLDQFFQPGKIRVLIVSGRNNHDWRSTTPFLRKVLTDTGLFDVRVTDEPAGLSLTTLLPYHVIIMNYCGPRLGQNAEQALGSVVRNGVGLVAVHGASYSFGEMEVLADNHQRTGIREAPWTDYFEMTGATWVEGPPKSGHGARHVFEVQFTDREHPITEGMGESFHISDELYADMKMKDGLNILATAFSAKSTGGTGEDEPMLWTLRYGKGRVFHTALGHDLAAMDAPGFITTFARGTEWAASGKVTLPAEMNAEAPKKDPVRVEVVIGGHDFPPSFYKLFDDKVDIEANVLYQPDAYKHDRLENTDVVVQYDLMQTITEEHRANLRRFLESGKGLVVLHHAIANYSDWKWWSEEVVHGRYIMPGGPDASTYKHDVELFTETVADHPVVKGVPPMRIVDETYKKMWISPKVKVLMTTKHPTSDGPLVWISPYDKSRVVYIQLGHGTEAHNHADYQKLVHNAILWVAGREP